MSIIFLVLVLAAVVAVLYLRGFLNLTSLLALYRRIRLAILLAVVAILIIGLLRILGIGTGD